MRQRAANAFFAPTGGTLRGMAKKGLIDRMEVETDYKGASIVPSRIRFHAWHSSRAGSFDPAVDIW